ncbi:spermidine/putrescine ABC transporter substrate-binding protein [Candidatus Babeliales bacterium]|nr:spermidine/putrescine ABC transporter substrate-binding protein [Candidatus Babeliales bacterium]
MNKFFIMKKSIIIIFWFFLIVLLLYVPNFISRFFEKKQEFNFLNFTDIVSPEVVKIFKDRTGIQVNVTYSQGNDEVLAKLGITRGKVYDLLVVSDYTVDLLRKKELIQKLDYNKLQNFSFIDKRIINRYFDPKNEYSIPISWDVYGIGYNKKYFGELSEASWDLIFKDPENLGYDYKVSMLDDPRESLYLASLFLFGPRGVILSGLDKITELLIKQKKWVESYTNDRQDYFLLSDITFASVITSAYLRRLRKESKNYDFIIPSEGSLMVIENLIIPSTSDKRDLVHKFINFLLSEEIGILNNKKFGYHPVNVDVQKSLNEEYSNSLFSLTQQKSQKIGIFQSELPRTKLEDLWLSVKAS